MDLNEIKDRIHHLERVRMQYVPSKYIRKFVKNTSDIYNERHLLKSVSFDNESIQYIVSLVVADLASDVRFRRVDCLHVLKRIIKNRSSNDPYSKELLKDLFYLYQNFIFNSNEEVQLMVNTFIDDQPLEDDDIHWLIDNCGKSNHIVNRLLSYPDNHPLLTNWARQVLSEGKLLDRRSEVIGILIEDDIPEDIEESHTTLIWAIYYSKASNSKKKKMLLKHLDYQNYSTAIEVADKQGFGRISKQLLKHYRDLLLVLESNIDN